MSRYLKCDWPEKNVNEPPAKEYTVWDGLIAFALSWGILIGGFWLVGTFILPRLTK